MAKSKGKPENLKPFKPGQSGNPKGRPKELPELKTLLEDVVGEDGAKEIIESLKVQARKGNVRAAEILLERMYGKTKQPIEHSGAVEITNVKELTDEDLARIAAQG